MKRATCKTDSATAQAPGNNFRIRRFVAAATAVVLLGECLCPFSVRADSGQDRTLSEHAAEAWQRCRNELAEILRLQDERPSLPRSAWFKRNRKDVDEEINALLDDVLEVLRVSGLTDMRAEYAALEQEIEQLRDEIRQLREERVRRLFRSRGGTRRGDRHASGRET